MTDGAFPDRLSQLRTRWDADPKSRVFLQLAEEYRHLGRVKDALAVLNKGLEEHPGYLSALVAKGRCHIELGEGEAARGVLERVVKQDATQMVANKLLVRAYLETGEPAKARERLDLYSLLNDSDPEIEELRRRIKALDRPASPAPAASAPSEEPRLVDADPFSLEPPAPRREVQADVFDIDLTPPTPLRPAAVAAPEKADEAEEPDDGSQPFPGLASRERHRRYHEGLAAEGLFTFAASATTASETVSQEIQETQESDESAWLEDTTPMAPPPEPEEPALFADLTPPPSAAVEAEGEGLWGEEPAPAQQTETAAATTATATLGELYLRQGYAAEAELIFREVLQNEPDNAAARAGLASLARRPEPEPLDARQLLAGFAPAPGQDGTAARKIHLLNHYLKRLRGGSARDVS